MKKIYIFFLIFLINVNIEAKITEDILIKDKTKLLKEKEELLKKEYIINKYSWIKDVNIKAKYEKNNDNTETQSIGMYIDQPIFNGGNIIRGIKSAKLKKEIDILALNKEKKEYIYEILNNVLIIDKLYIDLKTTKLKIQSNQIEYKKKLELYKRGLLDISFISILIIEKNNLENIEIDIKTKIKQQKMELEKISNKTYEYIKNNFEYKKYTSKISLKELLENSSLIMNKIEISLKEKEETINKYNLFPTVNIYANSEYQKIIKNNVETRKNMNNVGIKINIPLSVNKVNQYQKTKIDKLIKKTEWNLSKINLEKFYNQKIIEISSMENKKMNLLNAINEYKKLIKNLEEDEKIGLGIKSDIELLKKEKEIKENEIESYKNEVEQLYLEIHKQIIRDIK